MNAIRVLLLILLGWILWRLSQRWYYDRKVTKENNTHLPPSSTPKHDEMVRCDYCGLYLPLNEAIHSGEDRYCCEAHQHAART